MPRRFLLTLSEAMFEAISKVEAAILSILGLLFVPAVDFDLSLAKSLISKYVLISRAISRGSGYASLFLYFNVLTFYSIGRLHTSMYTRISLTFSSLKFVFRFESMASMTREKAL
jgi:hypothetical protein